MCQSSPQQRWHQAFCLLCCSVCPSDCQLHLVMDKPPTQVPALLVGLQFGSRCFSFNIQGKSWIDAENFCNSDGGNLASVHSRRGT
ncbi:hypothetical protein PFLUV_G00150160 [Perca fluviatilis]|uniref:C-type lectin domain-containing protein n=1 Tax=Perca fluviatilis TaxID=8168 RepID=A0A6A5F645_PERFL|nr:hypothetical protein PFLUV_G00150160 [Perca fluviatilis]